MLLQGLLSGVIVGFIISMPPLGPTYFAIIERALRREFSNAVAIGAGAGFLDMIYVLVAFGGVSALISILPEQADRFLLENENTLKIVLALAGCVIVIWYGIRMMMKSKVPDKLVNAAGESQEMAEKVVEMESSIIEKEQKLGRLFHISSFREFQNGPVGSFILGIGFCLSSVTLPASWLAIVGYLKSYGVIDARFSTGLMLGLGVFIGTTIWFYLMSSFLCKNTDKIKPNFVQKLNFSTGLFLVILGGVILFQISTMFTT